MELINSLGQDFNAYTSSVLQHVVDRYYNKQAERIELGKVGVQ